MDEPEKKISFWQASETVIPEETKEELKLGIAPTFLVYYKGELKAKIDGARFDELEAAINENVKSLNTQD